MAKVQTSKPKHFEIKQHSVQELWAREKSKAAITAHSGTVTIRTFCINAQGVGLETGFQLTALYYQKSAPQLD